MLEKIKILLGITDDSKDDLLTILIEQAIDEALSFTHRNSIDNLDSIIIQMVIYKYNVMGSEGVASEGYSGVSFTYSTNYPEPIIRDLKSKRKVVVL